MDSRENFPDVKADFLVPQNIQGVSRSRIFLETVLSTFMITACSKEGVEVPQSYSHQTEHKAPKSFNELIGINPLFIAGELEKILDSLDQDNKTRLAKVIDLMKVNLEGVEIRFEEFPKNNNVRAVSKYHPDPSRAEFDRIVLDVNWDQSNILDVSIFSHELLHLIEVKEARMAMVPEEWNQVFVAPPNATEIRTELGAWELTIIMLDKLSGGRFDKFYKEIIHSESPDLIAILNRYADELVIILHADPGQKEVIKDALKIYFQYRVGASGPKACAWSNNFATQIAEEFLGVDHKLYEITLPEDQYIFTDSDHCIRPLPGGPYESYNLYIKAIDPETGERMMIRSREVTHF